MYEIEFFKKLPSTNAYAKENLEKFDDFKVISADIQTKGHGQFERSWFSTDKNGGNCYISIVLKPHKTDFIEKLTQYASFNVAKTLEVYGLSPKFKYPNDVMVENKKIAGILAESIFFGNNPKGIVLGIGVNLNLEAEDALKIDQAATSVYIETGKKINKIEFINFLLDNLYSAYEDFINYGKGGEINVTR